MTGHMWFVIGIVIGIALGIYLYSKIATAGVLRIDRTNPGKDVYRFDLDSLDDLSNKKRIILQIDNNANLSQK